MKIAFKSIELNNFLSFENAKVELSDKGFTLVNGINNCKDDNALSNGSGKSSIWEAISWVLTGETIRGTKDIRRLNSSGECSVEAILIVDNNTYRIKRFKDPSNLKVFINDIDKSGKGIRDTETLLASYLPDLTSSLLGSVIVLGQGLPQRFTNNTPSGRKEVLETLSKSDFMIEDIKRRIADRKSEVSISIRSREDNILSESTRKEVVYKQLMQTKELLNNLPTKEIYEEVISKGKSSLNGIDNNIALATISKNKANDNLISLQGLLNIKLKESQIRLSNIHTKYSDVILNSDRAIVALEVNIRGLEKEIAELKSVKEFCPTCGQKLPDVHVVDTSEKELELSTMKSNLDTSRKTKLDLEAKRDEEVALSNSQYKLETSNLEVDRVNIETELNRLENELFALRTSRQQEFESLTRNETGLNNLIETAKSYNQTIDSLNIELVDLENKILYNKSELENLKTRLDIVSKMSTIATRDFRGYLLTNVINYINNKSKEYSKDIFDTDKIEFKLDGNNISISYDSKEYENLSGGEKQKVDLIVQFALRDMLCKFLDFSSNIIVLDELFDNLDSIGCNKVINLITSKLSDVDSIFIITHHSDISIPSDNEITIIKNEDKISRIL